MHILENLQTFFIKKVFGRIKVKFEVQLLVNWNTLIQHFSLIIPTNKKDFGIVNKVLSPILSIEIRSFNVVVFLRGSNVDEH